MNYPPHHWFISKLNTIHSLNLKTFPYTISASVGDLCKWGRKHRKKLTKTHKALSTLFPSTLCLPPSIMVQYKHVTAMLQKNENTHTY